MSQAGWRKWHRWIGLIGAPFLLFAAITGIIASAVETFSEDEEAREKAREKPSPVTLPAAPSSWSEPIAKALAGAAERAKGAPVDRVSLDFKSEPPTVTVFLGKPGGGEDRKLLFDARGGDFLREESYEDKSLIVRLHSGEAFGDWGLVLGMMWGLVLVVLIVSGLVIYSLMSGWRRKPRHTTPDAGKAGPA